MFPPPRRDLLRCAPARFPGPLPAQDMLSKTTGRHRPAAWLVAFVLAACSSGADRLLGPSDPATEVATLADGPVGPMDLAAGGRVVISQVYGGGGNAGATLKNDFIERYNNSTTAVSLSGWSVQYASSGGSSWAVTPLTGAVPAGGYYLVRQAAG